jgi:hypothetical protein
MGSAPTAVFKLAGGDRLPHKGVFFKGVNTHTT